MSDVSPDLQNHRDRLSPGQESVHDSGALRSVCGEGAWMSRARKKQRDTETTFGHGVEIRRSGRVVRFARTVDVADLRREWSSQLDANEESLDAEIGQLRDLMQPFDVRIIAGLSFMLLGTLMLSGRRTPTDEPASHAEYACLLRFLDPREPGREPIVAPADVQAILDAVKGVFIKTQLALFSQSARRLDSGADAELERVRVRVLLAGLNVRYPSYYWQEEDLLRTLSIETEAALRPVLGHSIAEALAVADAIQALVMERFNEAYRVAQEHAWRIEDGELGGDPADVRLQEGLTAMTQTERRARVASVLQMWLINAAGDAVTFDPADVAEWSGLPANVVDSVIRVLSLSRADVDETHYASPSATSPLIEHPLFDLGHGEFLTPVPGHLTWAVRPAIEQRVKALAVDGGSDAWEAYQSARAQYVEREAIDVLAARLAPQHVYRNARYRAIETDGERGFEVDGLLLLDRVLFIVEAKSGALSESTRRFAPTAMDQVDEIVGSASRQGQRVLDHINRADGLFEVDGRPVRIRPSDFDQAIIVNPNLEMLDVFATETLALRATGIVSASAPVWCVRVGDLATACAVLPTSIDVAAYLDRRLSPVVVQRVSAADEGDWLGAYIDDGLRLGGLPAAPAKLLLNGQSSVFDDHYNWHEDMDVPRPQLPSPRRAAVVDQFVRRLDAERVPGFLHAGRAVLGLSAKDAKGFVRSIQKARVECASRGEDAVKKMSAGGLKIVFVCTTHQQQAVLSSWHEEAAPGELSLTMVASPDSPKIVDQVVYSYGAFHETRSQ